MFKRISLPRSLAALLTAGVLSSTVVAAPPPQPSTLTMMVPNDGYLIVGNSGEEQAITPLFCPPGSVLKNGNKGCIRYEEGFLKPNTEPKPVTAQEALDLAYGPFRTKVVAIGPQGWTQSVIFWRRDPTYMEYRPAPGSNH